MPPSNRGGVPNRPPALPRRSERADEVVNTARRLLREEPDGDLSLRQIAGELGIRVPSLYKHLAGKQAIEAALIEVALGELGTVLRAAVAAGGPETAISRLLGAYRQAALAEPRLYRLATAGRLPRKDLGQGLEDWAGEPFFAATGDPSLAQALWAFTHGMVSLELDGRFPENSDLDRTWEAGAEAFAPGSGPVAPPSTPVSGTRR
ncbi:MAG: TetR/AcrR family transcriptional regulator [Acidimicrobiales bacterium]